VKRMESLLLNVVGETITLNIVHKINEPILVQADESQIEQVLLNLLTNAKDAMPDGGNITISLDQRIIEATNSTVGSVLEPGSYGLMTVTDSGCGMSHDLLENIFEPFFTTKPKGKGTGLGLSTAYGIIKQHNGEIIVKSTENNGSSFTIYIPTGTVESIEKQQEQDLNTNLPGGNETILLVEDEQLVRHLIKTILIGAGYRVFTANNGQSAVEKYNENKNSIDLVLMDVIMPQMNGRDAFNAIRSQNHSVRCIFMSGYTAEILAQDNIINGEFDFLLKPVRREDLLNIIRKVLER